MKVHTSSTQNEGIHNENDTTTILVTGETSNWKSRVSQRGSDEKCRKSAILIAIVIIGLILTGSVIGFLQLSHHGSSTMHKGSTASVLHDDGKVIPDILHWFNNKTRILDQKDENSTIDVQDTLYMQPLYRNYLLQTLYEYLSEECRIRMDKNDIIFQHVAMTYGGPWVVPPPPLDDGIDNNNTKTPRRLTKEQVPDVKFCFLSFVFRNFFDSTSCHPGTP